MSKCLQCGVAIESYTGRRPKKFCSDTCRATYHQKPRPKKNVLRATFDNVVKEKAALEMELAKFKANHVAEPSGHKIDIEELNTTPLDTTTPNSVTFHGGKKEVSVVDKSELIAKYEQELTTLPEKGQFAIQRRKWLKTKIYQLKNNQQ